MRTIIIKTDTVIWQQASKTKNILARPMSTLLNDPNITHHMLLKTLEGVQDLKADSMVCIGLTAADPWQQTPKKLLAKYAVSDVQNGWLVCTPKPENVTNVTEIDFEDYDPGDEIAIKAQWGEKQPDGSYLQYGKTGDYICQNPADVSDVWIVRKSFFEATYEIINDRRVKVEASTRNDYAPA